jgi:hypothetical protein
MTSTAPSPVDVLLEAAKRLTPVERGEFFDRFTEVLGEDERAEAGVISPEWMEEIKQRVADDEAGLSEWADAEAVVNKLRDSLKRPK